MATILIGALLIGVTLGLLGSGGSAITVPVLVYMVGHGAKESIAESMAIVGLISIAAAIPYARAGLIDWKSVWYFGIPGMAGTFVGAWLGSLAADAIQLVVFGAVLIIAAYAMISNGRAKPAGDQQIEPGPCSSVASHQSSVLVVALEGLAVGILTGFVGVGGGFLIVPALVLLGKLPMRLAIGTSLVIIAAKSAIGFAKYEQYLLSHESSVNPQTIFIFVVIGAAGSFMGRAINARLDQQVLKTVFASFLILLGGFVIVREGSKALKPSRVEEPTAIASSASTSKKVNLFSEPLALPEASVFALENLRSSLLKKVNR